MSGMQVVVWVQGTLIWGLADLKDLLAVSVFVEISDLFSVKKIVSGSSNRRLVTCVCRKLSLKEWNCIVRGRTTRQTLRRNENSSLVLSRHTRLTNWMKPTAKFPRFESLPLSLSFTFLQIVPLLKLDQCRHFEIDTAAVLLMCQPQNDDAHHWVIHWNLAITRQSGTVAHTALYRGPRYNEMNALYTRNNAVFSHLIILQALGSFNTDIMSIACQCAGCLTHSPTPSRLREGVGEWARHIYIQLEDSIVVVYGCCIQPMILQ